jgi:spore coat polysaccharide biosynthesis protein SpsF
MEIRVLALTQARFSSNRLSGKVLKEINGKSLLEIHYNRLKFSSLITETMLATTNSESDDTIVDLAERLNWKYYRGDMDDVLSRFIESIESLDYIPDYIVRLTADCPLIDPELIDSIIKKTIDESLDYCSNILIPTFPDGMDVEVMKYESLYKAYQLSKLKSDREHVTPFIWRNSTFKGQNIFKSANFASPIDYSSVRLTVDEIQDFEVVKKLIEKIGFEASWIDYTKEYLRDKEIYSLNSYISRNEGYFKSLEND